MKQCLPLGNYKLTIILLFLLLTNTPLSANGGDKNGGLWKTFLSYRSSDMVEDAGEKLFVVAGGSLLAYDKEFDSVLAYDRTNGLNDSDIADIRYSSPKGKLLIVYKNGNIDILSDEGTYNIPHLKNNTSIQDKTINRIDLIGNRAYISAAFGILVVDMEKEEIMDTYHLGINTYAVAIHKEQIFAATDGGIRKAALVDNLVDKGNWHTHPCNTSLFDAKKTRALFAVGSGLVYGIPNKGVYKETQGSFSSLLNASTLHSLVLNGTELIALCAPHFYLINEGKAPRKVGFAAKDITPSGSSSFWLAAGEQGAVCIKKANDGAFKVEGTPKRLNSPHTNTPYRLHFAGDKLYVAAGGKTANGVGFNTQGIVMGFENGQWDVIDQASVKDKFGVYMKDYTSLVVHPTKPNQLFAASFGFGLVRFEEGKAAALYNNKNSTIESVLPGKMDYDRIDGLAFDREGNLWMTNSEVQNPIKVLGADGKWHGIYNRFLTKQYTLNDILITSSGAKWFNIPRVNPSIVVFDEAGTLDNDKDDKSVIFQSFTDTDGKTIQAGSYTAMAEDRDGFVWVASNMGPLCFTSPNRALTEPESLRATRIKMENEDGSLFYFMDNIKVSCIKVDAGNRKWFGTESNGVYVLDASNTEMVHHFDTDNSPLLSNSIFSIDIDPKTGTVFIGTDKGLISYKGEAIEGKEDFSNVYAYPNPVRREMDDRVIITGLMDDSNVKITDLNGNLLYETKSFGGQASWNCRTAQGERVATGIYIVLASNEDGEGVVTKIMVVGN